MVGYAAVSFRNCEHPHDGAANKAKYLMIYVTGVAVALHGARNPRAPRKSFAESIFGVLHQFAVAKEGCVGLCLWVRTDNDRAVAFYRKVGFVGDPSGPAHRDTGAPHLTMRKLLASS